MRTDLRYISLGNTSQWIKGVTLAEFDDNYFEKGLQLLEAGDFEGAIALFDNAVKLGLGDIAAIHVCRGEALTALGRMDAAIESISAALSIEPYLAAAYFARGNIRTEQREFDLAINDYTMAIHIEPDFDEAYYSRALAYEERKRYADAEADLTRTLDLNPNALAAYEARGRMRAAQFKFDDAIADLSFYLRSGGGKEFDNHSETQSYLLILRAQRLFWRLIPGVARRG